MKSASLNLEWRLTFLDNVERRQMREQNDLFHTSQLLIRDLVAALKSFTQLRHIELQYPPFGMRRECNVQCLRVLASVTQNIFSSIRPRLVSLSLAGLLPIDIPAGLLYAGDGIKVTPPPIDRLDLDFQPGDMPSGEMARIQRDDEVVHYPLKNLYWMLNAVPNLTSLRIVFHLLDRSMRLFDWSGLQCTRLNTLELVQLEMPGTSLVKIIKQNAHSIRQVILESVYLLDGTWAAVYDSIASTEGINDISEIHGRKYPDDPDSIDTELDAASYRRLFAVVEKRRESQGLPSMRWPISAAGFVYHRDFSYMETG